MIRNKNFYFILALSIFFVGCSSKKYFEPTEIDSKISFENKLEDRIETANRYGAVLKNGSVITQNGFTHLKIDKNTTFLNESEEYYIIARDCYNIEIINKITQVSTLISTETCSLSASIKDNQLAVVLIDNSSNIYDIKTKDILFTQKGSASIAVNSLVVAPVFLDTLVVFPTLDGRLLVVDNKNFIASRNIIINSEKFFNNVIYLFIEGENMVAATEKRLVSVVSGKEFSYDANIKDVLHDKEYFYVLTLEGEVIELDKTLRVNNQIKLPFASLSALVIAEGKIFTLEKRGYLIGINKENFTYKVYKVKGMKSDKFYFYNKNIIYYDNYYLKFDKDQ